MGVRFFYRLVEEVGLQCIYLTVTMCFAGCVLLAVGQNLAQNKPAYQKTTQHGGAPQRAVGECHKQMRHFMVGFGDGTSEIDNQLPATNWCTV